VGYSAGGVASALGWAAVCLDLVASHSLVRRRRLWAICMLTVSLSPIWNWIGAAR